MAAEYDITIEPGTTFQLAFNWYGASTPVNLNYGARLNLRASRDKDDAPFFVSSTGNGLAASTPLLGSYLFTLTSQQTSSIPFEKGYYEVEIYTADATPFVMRLLKGKVLIDRT